ncbi:winged helix-turn-helix domain-containing protein [Buttiauxella agrestis]|uniref:winged helix-turn-helix domain-containing protein n=1 Tax=Buttiauxella agrestis TaxID=82977 RepID=UPI0015609EF8|nr:winged helix-turn-helix domain-containing protein [Buttiauxella agrestis]
MMNTVFLINDTLLFDPNDHSLRPIEGLPGSRVVIHTPASECLLLLLRHNHQVLTQRFLFEQVWEKQGAVVTTNALYQSIASLRKGLHAAGLTENIIKTVPKMGFKSVATVREGTADEFIVPVPVISLPPAGVNKETETALHELPQRRTRVTDFFNSRLAYLLAGIAFILSCGVVYMQRAGGESFYSDYSYIGQVNGCLLYSSWSGEEKSAETFSALGRRYSLTCKSGGVAYLTLNRSLQGLSVLICDRKIAYSTAECQSYIFRKDRYES